MAETYQNFIIDTDAGGDPDDSLAIVQACELGNVAAFVTSDESPDGARARFVQQLVRETGKDIPVFTGLESPHPGKHLLGHLAVVSVPQPPSIKDGFLELVSQLPNPHWVGIGSYTNLAWLGKQPDYNIEDMQVTVMGGRLASDANMRPEHNVKVDPDAALAAAQLFGHMMFVPSTVTMSEKMAVSVTHPALDVLRVKNMQSALRNFAIWFEYKHPQSYQHDLETLAYAYGAVSAAVKKVRINHEGRLTDDESSLTKTVYGDFDYDEVWRWFYEVQKV